MRNAVHAHGARLLVVDDNKVNRLLLGRGLEQQGHTVAGGERPRGAGTARRESFDLLLLDIQMPEMDGYEVLEQLAKDLQLRDLPVIVTSALEEMDGVVRCIELGAEDYLTKPVNPVLLKARIGASLEKKRLRDQQRELVRRFAHRKWPTTCTSRASHWAEACDASRCCSPTSATSRRWPSRSRRRRRLSCSTPTTR